MSTSSNSRTMTVREIIALHDALTALNGHLVTVVTENAKTGDKTTTSKLTPYLFGIDGKGGGKVRWNIAKNLTLLQTERDVFTKLRDALILEISHGAGSIAETDTQSINQLNIQIQSALDGSTTINGLLTISLDELNLEANPELSPSILAPLMLLITE